MKIEFSINLAFNNLDVELPNKGTKADQLYVESHCLLFYSQYLIVVKELLKAFVNEKE